jgi:tRNA A37 threonylcarbamoyladenosine dehydratase
MTIVDGDSVDSSNRNRQLLALRSTVGRPKAEVMAERLLDVNPNLRLTVLQRFLDPEGAAGLVVRPPQQEEENGNAPPSPPAPHYDFVLDCIDSIAPKVALIAAAARSGSRVVAAMGAGGRVDPSRVRLVDAAHTQGDALGRAVRKGLKKAGVLLAGGGDDERGGSRRSKRGAEDGDDDDDGATTTTLFRPPPGAIVCVFSDEPARRASLKEARSPNNPYKASYFGTSSYVPATFGLVAASAVVRTVGDRAAMGELLWVPPSVVAAKERAKRKRQKASEKRRRAAEVGGEGQPQQQPTRRKEVVAAAAAAAGTAAGGGGDDEATGQQPEDPQAARLRAWADRTLPAAGGAFEI